MANISHSAIPDAGLHQCKGVAAASAGAIIVADGAGSSATSNNANTPVNLYDNELRRAELKDYSETKQVVTSSAGAATINIENGNVITSTLTENITSLTISNPPSTGNAGTFTWIITQDGTGSRTVTWPASVLWAGGSAPTLSTAAAAIDIVTFLTVDAGTTWFGFSGGQAFA